MTAAKLKQMEHDLQRLQRRWSEQRDVKARDDYRRLHARWVAALRQLTIEGTDQ